MMRNNDKRHLYGAFISAQKSLGLYIHIPFCKKRCYYCDFLTGLSYGCLDQYIGLLLKEINLYHSIYGALDIDNIYIGGGTPSSIGPDHIVRILDRVYTYNNVFENSEISIEVNPESINEDKLKAYKNIGINRISMGCQSFDNEKLAILGRLHKAEDTLRAYDLIRQTGFNNVNLDLIFALPYQTKEDLKRDLHMITRLDPEHISAYSLILEEGTSLYKKVQDKDLSLVTDEEDRAYYHYLIEYLQAKGYLQYEISNFSKPAYESRHNLKYWRLNYYLGLGLGSSSFFDGKRFKNHEKYKDYKGSIESSRLARTEIEQMDYDKLKIDYILMNLRLVEGIDREEYRKIFNTDFYEDYKGLIDSFVENNNMALSHDRVSFTRSGFDISNLFYVEII